MNGETAGRPGILAWLKFRETVNRLRRGERSWLRLIVVTVFAVSFWAGLYGIFDEGLRFILRYPDMAHELMEYLLAIFFFFLGLMLAFSNGIISWTSLFRARETAWLMSSPIRVENIFMYKYVESLWFSSWAFLFLGTPLMAAYGRRLGMGPAFYLVSALLFGLFIFIPAGIGSLAALTIARFMPRMKRGILIAAGAFLLAALLFLVYTILELRGVAAPLSQRWMRAVLSNLAFAQSPLCPSYWVAGGISALASARPQDALLYAVVLLANALIFIRIPFVAARAWFFDSWCAAQGGGVRRRFVEKALVEKAWSAAFFFCPEGLRLLMLKDLRSFVRDPVQWSQFLIFFGLLGVYFLNLKTFGYHLKFPEWRTMIALLNLCATSLTLSTFTSRFIYPQLSLEGRRFWLLGAAPMERRSVLLGKFLFCFAGSFVVAETLILLSSLMLKIPASTMLLHAVATVGICFGLAGLSVGIGAVYPDFREDNPSKIVAGFGGTLNLIISLAFVAAVVSIPAILGRVGWLAGGEGGGVTWGRELFWALGAIGVVSGLAGLLPMAAGFRSIRRMEI